MGNHGKITKSDIKLTNNNYLRIKDVMEITEASYSVAQRLVAQANRELADKGYMTFPGRVPRVYMMQRLGLEGGGENERERNNN